MDSILAKIQTNIDNKTPLPVAFLYWLSMYDEVSCQEKLNSTSLIATRCARVKVARKGWAECLVQPNGLLLKT